MKKHSLVTSTVCLALALSASHANAEKAPQASFPTPHDAPHYITRDHLNDNAKNKSGYIVSVQQRRVCVQAQSSDLYIVRVWHDGRGWKLTYYRTSPNSTTTIDISPNSSRVGTGFGSINLNWYYC